MKKTRIAFLLCLVALVAASCNWQSVDKRTPYTTAGNFISHKLGGGLDTLRWMRTTDGIVLDTVYVGDSVHFMLLVQAYYNNLMEFTSKWDTAACELTISADSLRAALDKDSKPETGYLHFLPGYSGATFPAMYVVRKEGKHAFRFSVSSDADLGEGFVEFEQPVVKRPEPKEEEQD